MAAICVVILGATCVHAETGFVVRPYRGRPVRVASAQKVITALTAAVSRRDAASVAKLAADRVYVAEDESVDSTGLREMLASPRREWGEEVDIWMTLRRALAAGFTEWMPGYLCAPHAVRLMEHHDEAVVSGAPASIRARPTASSKVLQVVRDAVLRVDHERWYSREHRFVRHWIPVVSTGGRIGYVLRDHIWMAADVDICIERQRQTWRVRMIGSAGPP